MGISTILSFGIYHCMFIIYHFPFVSPSPSRSSIACATRSTSFLCEIPCCALASRVIDPLGCGDALLTTASLTLAAGGTLHAAALLGSIAAAHEAQQLGNEPLTTDAILSKLTFPAAARLAS